MSGRPRLAVTGAAGFLGRRLIESLASGWEIHAIDRREPPSGLWTDLGSVHWHRADVAEREAMAPLFASLRAGGGVDVLVHLAGHYDFTGRKHPEYERTNVGGTRLLLELARDLAPRRFVFASSIAACEFPAAGRRLDESSPPDGRHVYAWSKCLGERMVAQETSFPTVIARFAALVSDWCEYVPLYRFLETWLSPRWNRRILGGRGESAIPYLHVRDACAALGRVVALADELERGEILAISPNGATSHAELYRAAAAAAGLCPDPLRLPRPLAAAGIVARDLLGRSVGRRPFERPWMARMIDRRLEVDASRTHRRLGWWPRERMAVTRRLPHMLENRRSQPWLWAVRNRARIPGADPPPEHRVLRLLERHADDVFTRLTATLVAGRVSLPHDAAVSLFASLDRAIRHADRAGFADGCRELAHQRARRGMAADQQIEALRLFERACLDAVLGDPAANGLEAAVRDAISGTIAFGIDAVEDAYERLGGATAVEDGPLVRAR